MNICWFISPIILLYYFTPGDCIVGGHVSVPHSRPYMVYIRDSRTDISCGGFLVREDFVMTTAHCNKQHLKVYLGVKDTEFLRHGIEVDSFPHPHFKYTPGNDIMLLKLRTPATLNQTVNTIALPNLPWNEKIAKDCLVLGWGSTEFTQDSLPRVLNELNITPEDLTICLPDILCNKNRVGPSKGDSGGPLVCGDIAHGMVSWNRRTTSEDYITGYTFISQHLLWIHEVMKAPPRAKPGMKAPPRAKPDTAPTRSRVTKPEENMSTANVQILNICIKTPSHGQN